MPRLVLMRHAQSVSNLERRLAGWEDSDLTELGRTQAAQAGDRMRRAGLDFDVAYASVLRRAIKTLWIALERLNQIWIEQRLSWRLNERHCGAFQGRPKDEGRSADGRLLPWRTELDVCPPLLLADDPRHPRHNRRYAQVDPALLPAGESLAMALERVRPLWETELAPSLRAGQNLLVVAHGNVVWLMARRLLGIETFQSESHSVPNATPLVIDLAADLTVVSSEYLDPPRIG